MGTELGDLEEKTPRSSGEERLRQLIGLTADEADDEITDAFLGGKQDPLEIAKNIRQRLLTEGDPDWEEVCLALIRAVNCQATAQLEERQRAGEKDTEREALVDELQLKVKIDPLTGLWNKGTFATWAPEIFNHFKESCQPLSYLMIDFDFFHDLNYAYGHNAGDFILKRFGEIIREELRISDLSFRGPSNYGDEIPFVARDSEGEEFSIILPYTGLEGACLVAERIRKRVEEEVFMYQSLANGKQRIPFTVSIGVAEVDFSRDSDFATLKERVDFALLDAKKRQGRNAVVKSTHTKSDNGEGITSQCISPRDREKPIPPKKPRYETA